MEFQSRPGDDLRFGLEPQGLRSNELTSRLISIIFVKLAFVNRLLNASFLATSGLLLTTFGPFLTTSSHEVNLHESIHLCFYGIA